MATDSRSSAGVVDRSEGGRNIMANSYTYSRRIRVRVSLAASLAVTRIVGVAADAAHAAHAAHA